MKPMLEDLFMGPLASPSFSEGFRWEDSRRRVRVIFADVTVADSKRVMLLHEFGRLPVFYFPLEDVRRDLLEATEHHDPGAYSLDEGQCFPLCQPQPLRQLFQTVQLGKVEVRPITVPTTFHDFDDYWTPFLGGQGPAPGYVRSLSEEQRVDLREHLRATLPIAADGSIPLIARAWAVRGVQEN